MTRPTHFYEIGPPEDDDNSVSGIAEFRDITDLNLVPDTFTRIDEWPAHDAELSNGEYSDFLPNDFCVRLFSARLRAELERLRGQSDSIQWLPVSVRRRQDARTYFVMHFDADVAPLNPDATKWIDDSYPRVPILRASLVGRHHLFAWKTGGYTFFGSLDVKTRLMKKFPGCFAYRAVRVA